jgi:hypothetical protein
MAATSSPALGGMNSIERHIEFPHHLTEWRFESGSPPDQHIIVTATKAAGDRKPHNLAQAAPHAIALHGIADLPRHREADTNRTVVGALTGLQNECPAGGPGAGCGRPKVRPAFQSLHGNDLGDEGVLITH